MTDVKIHTSWKLPLAEEFEKEYFERLSHEVREEYTTRRVYPRPEDVFRAFDLCPFDQVKVVIVGQDPYHGPGQANGLCFAVSDDVRIPPSLRNIFKEIAQDLGVIPYNSGDLSRWARQGVLLLNSVLTVRSGAPASHKGKGWERFTDAVISALNTEREGVVYMLWGKYAQEKGTAIDRTNNLILTSAHPSPFSATGFFGNHHFRRCNTYLEKKEKQPIDWR